jgi:hypothetical protein
MTIPDQPDPPALRSLEEFKTHPAFLDGTLGLGMRPHPHSMSIRLGEHHDAHSTLAADDDECGGTVTVHHECNEQSIISHPLTEIDFDG